MSAEYELNNHVCPHCKSVYRAALVRCALDGHELIPFEVDPLVDAEFADRYVIEECIGVGGMGRVYRARHQNVSRRFAVKVLFGELASDRTMRARFAREAEAASRLDHPNVVAVVDFGQTGEGLLYLVMDFIEGPTLREFITEKAPLTPTTVIDLSIRLARGLGHAHKLGLVHRDFKPGNVIVQERDDELVPRIVDFGIAMLDDPSAAGSRLTQSGAFIGTPACMAPEQAAAREVDHRADLYSLGVTMYEMLSGKPPFVGPGLEVIHQHCLSPVPPMSERAPTVRVPTDLETIIRQLMEKKPDARQDSARTLVGQLKAVRVEATHVGNEPSNAPVSATRQPMPMPAGASSGAPTPLPPGMHPAHRATTPLRPGSHPGPPVMTPAFADSQPYLRPATPGPMPALAPHLASTITPASPDRGASRMWIVYVSLAGMLIGLAVAAILVWSGSRDEPKEVAAARAASLDAPKDAPELGPGAQVATSDPGPAAGEASIDAGAALAVNKAVDASFAPSNKAVDASLAPSKVDMGKTADAAAVQIEVDAQVPPTKAAPRKTKKKPVRTRQPPRPRTTEVSREQFLARYRSVGALLVKLSKVAPSAAAPLRARYKRISVQTSLRSPEVRATSHRSLGGIRSATKSAIRRAK